MAGLKESKDRIKSIKSTKKMTQAMRMVSAAKFRRLEEAVKRTRLYASGVTQLLGHLKHSGCDPDGSLVPLLRPASKIKRVLCLVITSTRGLCGSLNSNVLKQARLFIQERLDQGVEVDILCIGKKGFENLGRSYSSHIVQHFDTLQDNLTFAQVQAVAQVIFQAFRDGRCEEAHIFYTSFHSILTQKPRAQILIPLALDEVYAQESRDKQNEHEFLVSWEPSSDALARYLVPHAVEVNIFTALLDSMASEQGARMLAMDNATKNADEMIKKLTRAYNRKRQGNITKELIEIISGCEALT